MAVEGRSFLDVAKILLEQYIKSGYQDEHIARSCISRAYYAAFLEARDKAGIKSSSVSVHSETYNYYASKKPAIKNRLVTLKEYRAKADYQLHLDVQLRDTQLSLSAAEKIIKDLDAMS